MKKTHLKFLKKIFFYLIGAIVIGLIFLLGLFIYYAGQLPDPSVITARHVNESTKIYDRSGETLLYDVHGEEKRTIIPWDQMSQNIKNATLAVEDSEFYSHQGIDVWGIIRAVYKDIVTLKASQGGSTITQQLVKKALLSDEKTIPRKIKEIALSIQIERKYTKDQIFWMYLNQIPYGSNAYGIEAASLAYFNKHAGQLSISEAATLAAIPQAPTFYSPYGNHVPDLINRRNYVLERMKSLGYITDTEYQSAIKENPNFNPPPKDFQAAHFVIMVKEYLINKYGEDVVENGGLKVYTTLDTKLQGIAEDVVTKYGKINAEKYKATNAAFTSIDPKTGQILAMVGSRDYFDIANEGNFNVATAPRQPGSSFKPFAYAQLISKGFTDSTVLFDLKTEFQPSCDSLGNQEYDAFGIKCYHPQNYDGKYRGPITAREALGQSLNVPSVQVLYLAGLDDTIGLAHKMGITTLNDRSRYGLSLVLGGGEVKLVDMVSSYGVFANDGIKENQSFILKVVANDGTILEEYRKDEERVLDPQVARMISDILSDNKARSPIFGYNSSLYFSDRQVAAKTGTTQENRDGWIIGYTPSLVAGVWTGNNNNTPMTAAGAGVSAAGPMWHEFMSRALDGISSEDFIQPDPIQVDKIMLNGQYLGSSGIHSILFYVDKNNPLGPQPTNPSQDPQFQNWEAVTLRWAESFGQPVNTPLPTPTINP
jgi:1A family penicillin-binding protein